MDTQLGFQPAQQSQGLQPFVVPFEQLYGHLAQKQNMYDVAEAKSNEFLIKIGGITDLLAPDIPLAAERYKNVMTREEELRTSVNGDLANPEYRKGLNRLMVETATDPFWGIATHNYAVANEKYLPDVQAYQLKFGQAPAPWNDEFSDKLRGYQGADVSGRLEYKGVAAPAEITTEMFEMAKQIIPNVREGFYYDPKLNRFINEKLEVLSATDIKKILSKHDWGYSPAYAQMLKRAEYLGISSDELFEQALETTARTFSVNNYATSVGPDGGDGIGNTKGGDGENTTVAPIVNVSVDSSGFEDIEAMENAKINLRNGMQELTSGDSGFGTLVELIQDDIRFKNLGGEMVNPSLVFDNESGSTAVNLTAKINGKLYNLANIPELENSGAPKEIVELAKSNILPMLKIKEKYTALYKNMEAIEELDARLMAETGFNSVAKHEFETKYSANIDAEFTNLVNTKADYQDAIRGIFPGARFVEMMKNAGGITGLFKALTGPAGANKAVDDNIKNITTEQKEFLKQLKNEATANVMKDKNYKLYESYNKYQNALADTYGTNGKLQSSQYSNSFGYTPEAIRATEMVAKTILSNIVGTGDAVDTRIVLINPTTDEQYNADDMGKIQKGLERLISEKTIEGQLDLTNFVTWRYDDTDGIVFEMNVGGYRVEVQNMNNTEALLGSINAHSAAYLHLLTQASASLQRPDAGNGQGDANLVGYLNVPKSDGSYMPVYFNRLAFKEKGINGLDNSIEEFGPDNFKYKDQLGNTRYYKTLADIVTAIVKDFDSTVQK